ncbi:Gfo/Idh/MocA family oxidoreductase [Nakamurella sp. PAMC28650]|uniref:Gfo/Idh/MocA family protein n=1 Tax=Nakamurella sp. PAMC28650 TaxID=2762325 RepID=UPI00164EC590|nr:Gfo/Idh/MocA family oxidoreductase [Nakamurella sp. PAMC28650]QNK82943.1 Gfo/Idh/MocA family oxidoreductase [Nakamurella sp. PAMC28650]
MNAVPFGLVGFGFGGRYFHAPLIDSADECELVGIVTSSPERRRLVGEKFPNTEIFASLAALAAAGAQAVTICTPADTHTALTEEALRLGLAVVCDKPFALNATAARSMVELARQLRLLLTAYQNRRWDSDFLTVRKLVAEGVLGNVTRFESRFERFAPLPGPSPAGGGTLLDFCSHLVDQALVLLGPAVAVYAEFRTRESGLDDDVFLALTHDSGARSQLWGSWSQAAPGPRYRVTGTAATYVLEVGDTQENALVAGETPASLGDRWGAEQDSSWGHLYRGSELEVIPTQRGRWDTFYPAFAAAVQHTASVPVDPRDAIATAEVLDAAKLSATTRSVVPLP